MAANLGRPGQGAHGGRASGEADVPREQVDPRAIPAHVQAVQVVSADPGSTFRHLAGSGCVRHLRHDTGLLFVNSHPDGVDVLEQRCTLCGRRLAECSAPGELIDGTGAEGTPHG